LGGLARDARASEHAPGLKDAVIAVAAAAADLMAYAGGGGGRTFWDATGAYREAQDAWGILERRRSFEADELCH
jgi:hypothetical protein